MQGFYLTDNDDNIQNSKNIFEKKGLTCDTILNTSNFHVRFFYKNGEDYLYKEGNDFIANIGIFIYKNRINLEALKLFLNDLRNGSDLVELANATKGFYCLFLFFDNRFYMITDKNGIYPIYIYKTDKIFEISSSFLALAKLNNVTLHKQGIAEYLCTGVTFHKTIVTEINLLDAGTVYEIRGNGLHKNRYYRGLENISFNKYRNLKETSKIIKNILFSNLKFVQSLNNVGMNLTGGFDTRLLASILLNQNIDFECEVIDSGSSNDVAIAQEIASKNNLKLQIRTDHEIYEKNLTYERRYYLFDGVQDSYLRTRFSPNKTYGIFIGGSAGGEEFGPYKYSFEHLNRKFNAKEFILEQFPYSSLIRRDFYSEEQYVENLTKFINQKIAAFNNDNARDIRDYLGVLYLMIYCGFITSVENILTKEYFPYLEANFIKTMLEVSPKLKFSFKLQRKIMKEVDPKLAAINSTHGYPPAPITISNFYRFGKLYQITILAILAGLIKGVSETIYNRIKNIYRVINNKILFHKNEQEPLWVKIIKKDYSNYLKKYNDSLKIFSIIDRERFEELLSTNPTLPCQYSSQIGLVVTLARTLEEINICE